MNTGRTPHDDRLKPVSFFSGLTKAHRNIIQANCKQMNARKGSILLQQDEESFDLYVIESGRVKVSLINEDGREIILDILNAGDIFGELSLLDKKSRSAMVSAITDVDMLFLPRASFLKVIRENTDIAISLLSIVTNRLRKANETIETLSFLDVAGRVARFLIDTARETGEEIPDGVVKFRCPTHVAIAGQVFASREAVTKAIKALAANGMLSIKGREAFISSKQFEIL